MWIRWNGLACLCASHYYNIFGADEDSVHEFGVEIP